jgi:hypothetical protein
MSAGSLRRPKKLTVANINDVRTGWQIMHFPSDSGVIHGVETQNVPAPGGRVYYDYFVFGLAPQVTS